MKKILITGAAGFIGFWLSKKLAENEDNNLTLVDNLGRGRMDEDFKALLEKDNVDFIKCDLTSKEDVKNIEDYYDQVYHLAAKVGVKHCETDPESVLRVNILSLMNILDLVKENKCKKIVFSSTSETYSGGKDFDIIKIPTDETVPLVISDPFNPRFSYAGSKIVGEQFVIHSAKKYGFEYNIIRYHNIYGPRMGYSHVIPEVVRRLLKGEDPFKVYGHDQTRAFCFIEDAVDATILSMETDQNNQVYHIGNPEEVTIEHLTKGIGDILDIHPELELVPPPKGSVSRRCPDISKLKKIGYDPKISLKDGLDKTVKWYKGDLEKNGAWE